MAKEVETRWGEEVEPHEVTEPREERERRLDLVAAMEARHRERGQTTNEPKPRAEPEPEDAPSDGRSSVRIAVNDEGEAQIVGFVESPLTAAAMKILPATMRKLMARLKKATSNTSTTVRVEVEDLACVLHLLPHYQYSNAIMREDLEVLLAFGRLFQLLDQYNTRDRLPDFVMAIAAKHMAEHDSKVVRP